MGSCIVYFIFGRKFRRGGGARLKMIYCGCYGYYGVKGGILMGILYIL